MDALISMGVEYGVLIVFATVLIEQLGVPLPAYPVLLFMGSRAAQGELSLPALGIAALSAAVLADSLWYLAGRRFGRRVLGWLCQISLSPDSCVRQTELIFSRWGAPSLVVAKFVPGFASVATVLAGATGIRRGPFLFFDAFGAVLWVGGGLGIGLFFADAIVEFTSAMEQLGLWALGVSALIAGLWLLHKWWRRYQFTRKLRVDRVEVKDLLALIERGEPPLILDVRAFGGSLEGRIPGALPFGNDREWPIALREHPRDALIVVYCSCPNDASAVVVARRLFEQGFSKVRPLAGGMNAWLTAGRDVAP